MNIVGVDYNGAHVFRTQVLTSIPLPNFFYSTIAQLNGKILFMNLGMSTNFGVIVVLNSTNKVV